MNGDVLTDLDYSELLAYHVSQQNVVTIATHQRSIKIDSGVVRTTPPPELRQQTLAFVRAVGRQRSGAPGTLVAASAGAGTRRAPALPSRLPDR